jgi:hypothetical protein
MIQATQANSVLLISEYYKIFEIFNHTKALVNKLPHLTSATGLSKAMFTGVN